MKGIILKDIFNLRGQFKLYAMFPILAFFLSYMQQSYVMFIFMMAMLVISIPISSFAYDDMADFSPYALTLPLGRKDIVLSKFILAFIVSLIAIVFSILGMFILVQIFGSAHFGGFNFFEQSKLSIIVILSINVMNCLTFPVVFKYGTEKGRMMLFAFAMGISAIVFLLNSLINSLSSALSNSVLSFMASYGFIVGALLLILVEAGSIMLSNKIMDKKEF